MRNGTAPVPLRAARADVDRQEAECRALLGVIREAGSPTLSRRYDRGQTVYREGDPASALYILTEGTVKLCRAHSEDKEATLRLLGAWDFFGDAVLGRRTAHMSRAEAVTPCEIVKVPLAFVERTARERSEAALGLARLLGLELARHKEWIDCVLPRLTHEELAQMIATSREAVSGAVNDLRRRELLRSERGRIVLSEPLGSHLRGARAGPSAGR